MPIERPVVVLVFAILNIVFGSIGLVYSLCSGAALGLVYGLLSSAGSGLPGRSTLPIPPFPSDVIAVTIAEMGIQFILSTVLLFAGIGLLRMKSWARKLCIALSMIGILFAVTIPPVKILYVNSRMEKWQEDLQETIRDQQKNSSQQIQISYKQFQTPTLNAIGALFMPILILTYAIIMLVFMFRPVVSEAFARRTIGREAAWDRESEEDVPE